MFKTTSSLIIWMLFIGIVCPLTTHACSNTQKQQYFTENKGQWKAAVQFKAQTKLGDIYLEKEGLTYLLHHPEDIENRHRHHHKDSKAIPDAPMRSHAFRVKWLDAQEPTAITGDCASSAYYNFFIGNDPSQWASGVQVFNEVNYQALYEGIDLLFYGKDDRVKYDFVVEAGSDPTQIAFTYEGIDGVQLVDGSLQVKTSVNTLIEKPPFAYQYINKQLKEVPCHYQLEGQTVRFEFPEGYDDRYQLVIDPELEFSTYTGSSADNFGFTATYDDDGHLYAGGIVFGSGYPTTLGAFQEGFAGSSIDMGISKFSPDGSELIYSTYLGGSNGNEPPHSLIVDQSGSLIVLGTTGSSDFPTTSNAYDRSFNGGSNITLDGVGVVYQNGADIIIAKLSADGQDLESSTYVGGIGNDGLNIASALKYNYADELRGEVFLDKDDNILIATSTNSTDFPTTLESAQAFNQGGLDGCIMKFDTDLQTLAWSTLLGGTGDDAVYSVKLDSEGNVFVGGGTDSEDFPVSENGFYSRYLGGQADAFVMKLSADGSTILAGTFLGTNFYDQAYFVEVDEEDFVYTYGQTAGDYLKSGDVFVNENSGQFIHKLSNDLQSTIFSTTFGNGNRRPNISPTAFLVDKCGKIYISGWGGDVNFSAPGSTTNGLPVSNNAIQPLTDGSDFYFLVLEKDAFALHYATFFGADSNRGEHVDGGTSRFDKEGKIYQAVCSCAPNSIFPTTPNAWSRENNSSNCNLAAIKFSFETTTTIADFDISPPTCTPYTAIFTNESINGEFYEWDFGDPSSNTNLSTEASPVHVYTEPGTYTVRLTVENPESCNGVDVLEKTIVVTGNTENQVELDVPSSMCVLDLPVLLSASVTGGVWSGDGVFGNVFDPNIGPGTYTLSYASQEGACGDVSTTTIQVNNLPEIIVSEPVCNGKFAEVLISVTGDDNNYELDITQNSENLVVPPLANNESATFEFLVVDSSTLNITATGDISNCSTSMSFELAPCSTCEDEIGTVDIGDPIEACQGEQGVQISINSSNGIEGTWSGDPIIKENNIIDTSDPGIYEVIYTIQLEECEVADTTVITILENPIFEPLSGPICVGPNTVEIQFIVTGSDSVLILNDTLQIESGIIQTFLLPVSEIGYLFTVKNSTNNCSSILTVGGTTCSSCDSSEDLEPVILCTTDTIIVEAQDAQLAPDQSYFFIFHDTPIVDLSTALAVNTSGIFPITPANDGTYQRYYITPLLSKSDDNGNPSLFGPCTTWGCTQELIVLPPIEYNLVETCDKENKQFHIRLTPSGGLAAYDPTTAFQITGDQGELVPNGDTFLWSIELGSTATYLLRISDQTSCETISLTGTGPGSCNKEPTPIELLSFTATETDEAAIIEWETVSEQNNDYFTLEYSQDGIHFVPLTQIEGAGTSNRMNTYQYIDELACGTTYYRLTWTNYNGQKTIGQVLSIQQDISNNRLQISPNPTKEEVQVEFKALSNSNIQVAVYNVAGQQLLQKDLAGKPCRHQLQLSMRDWPTGVYFLRISNGEWQYEEKLIKIE